MLTLPKSASSAPDGAVLRSGAPVSPFHRGTILLVDDEPFVRDVTAGLLEHHGYTVMEAANGRDALALLERGTPVDVLIVDFQMPGMNGVAVAEAAGRLRPELPVLFLTGHGAAAALHGVTAGAILEKPVRDAALAAKLEALLAE